jgi:S1-C subfamily serine protease
MGVYVRLSQHVTGVLTSRDAVGGPGEITVSWSDGTKSVGRETWADKTGANVVFLDVSHPTIKPLPIASSQPKYDDIVEHLVFNDKETGLRPHTGRVMGFRGQEMASDTPVVMGDSGAAVVNSRGEVVGLVTYGENLIDVIGGKNVYRPSSGPGQPILWSFAERLIRRG